MTDLHWNMLLGLKGLDLVVFDLSLTLDASLRKVHEVEHAAKTVGYCDKAVKSHTECHGCKPFVWMLHNFIKILGPLEMLVLRAL